MGQVGDCRVNTGLWSDGHTWRQGTQGHVPRPPGLLPSWPPNSRNHTQVSEFRDIPYGRARGLPSGQIWLCHTL